VLQVQTSKFCVYMRERTLVHNITDISTSQNNKNKTIIQRNQ